MVKHQEGGRAYWCLPGGALESSETPEQGALRELEEECHVTGTVIRQTNHILEGNGIEAFTYAVDIGLQEPRLGQDPELDPADAILVDVQWSSLHEIAERDRAFLWQAGLMTLPGFLEIVEGWGSSCSYPDDD